MNPIVRKRIVTALMISLVFHTGFLVWSYFAKILPEIPFFEKPEAVFHVKIERQESEGRGKLQFDKPTSYPTNKSSFASELMAKRPLVELQELFKDNIDSNVPVNKQSLASSAIHQDEMFKRSDRNDLIITKKTRRAVRENLVAEGDVPHENFTSGAPVFESGDAFSKNFLDKSAIPAKSFSAALMRTAAGQNGFQEFQPGPMGIAHQSQAVDLGTALTYQLFKYTDPASGQKYFKLLVKVRDATMNFPVVPKEVIFLVDASGSIGKDRLAYFEEGLMYSLKHLNPHDRFNIVIFKNKPVFFSPVSLGNSNKNIKDAIEFIQDIQAWSTTDIYQALRSSIDLKNPFVPSYRVVMTDGYPTKGMVDTRHVINEISTINDNKVSIFTFGGGVSVDRYMLDFIAFKNRGWSTVVDRQYLMGRQLCKLYDEIKDPLLLNVRYYVSSLDESQIFPQVMPDFFKGSSFVIYGRYTKENKFIVQIRGEMAKDKKEFIVNASLLDALPGDRQIAYNWAFHKVYYLISQLKYNENNETLLQAINDLCEQFHIITPYSIGLQGRHASSVPRKVKTTVGAQAPKKIVIKAQAVHNQGVVNKH
ncbi:MAG: VWA domain-containing protein [Candidatus Omnitrophica bacterium]|nr:VWA domain-containing protein [Candidatus Omnitrophota bacterium]